ncbi:hypothetical protein D9M71_784380 [compost metagenome]
MVVTATSPVQQVSHHCYSLFHAGQTCFAPHLGQGQRFAWGDDVVLAQQIAHDRQDPVHGELLGVAHLGIAAVGGEQLVLAVE